MNTKKIPALVMLSAGAVSTIVTYINGYELTEMLAILVLTLVVFLIIGVIIKLIFDSFHIEEPDEDRVDDEGEVVEKTEIPEDEEAEDSQAASSEEGDESDEAGA